MQVRFLLRGLQDNVDDVPALPHLAPAPPGHSGCSDHKLLLSHVQQSYMPCLALQLSHQARRGQDGRVGRRRFRG